MGPQFSIDLLTFLYAFIGFCSLLLTQLIVWKLAKFLLGGVRHQISLLFILFLGVPLGLHIFGSADVPGTLLLLAISAIQLMTFPAAQAKSPSLEILLLVRAYQKSGGISREEISRQLTNEKMLSDRVKDLADDGLLKRGPEGVSLNFFGKALAHFFHSYRQLFGLQQGGG